MKPLVHATLLSALIYGLLISLASADFDAGIARANQWYRKASVQGDALDQLLKLADSPAGFHVGLGMLLEDILTRWWADLMV